MKVKYNTRFRCYYETNYTEHHPELELCEIPKWIEAYQFTHPQVKHINVSVWVDHPLPD